MKKIINEVLSARQCFFNMRLEGGFTLIELLVVVLIIGILSAVALPQYNVAVEKSRAAGILPLGRAIATAQEVYWLANGEYTPELDLLDIEVPLGWTKDSGGTLTYPNGNRIQITTTAPKSYIALSTKHVQFDINLSKHSRGSSIYCYASENNPVGIKVCANGGPATGSKPGCMFGSSCPEYNWN